MQSPQTTSDLEPRASTGECRAEINLAAIRNNLRLISEKSSKSVIAVIKANAYGHGALACAQAAMEAGCSGLAVARLSEALSLRYQGITAPILIFDRVPAKEVSRIIAQNLTVTVFDPAQVAEYASEIGNGEKLKVHVKVDTGMGRLGVESEQADTLVDAVTKQKAFDFEGIYSHFAKADETDAAPTDRQKNRFSALLKRLAVKGQLPHIIHLSNSAGALFHQQLERCTHVRAGIAMYGLNPSSETVLPTEFQPALCWKTELASIKTLHQGQQVSYGGRYQVSTPDLRVGVIMVGYADGFRRTTGNHVIMRGRLLPVIGTICMDQCMVDLSDCPDAQIGDEVTLIGRDGGLSLSADDLAKHWNTINYEITCGISARVQRIFIEKQERKPQ